jgi:hypothetical protein
VRAGQRGQALGARPGSLERVGQSVLIIGHGAIMAQAGME